MDLPECTISYYDLPESAHLALAEWLGVGDDVKQRLVASKFDYRAVPVEEMKAFIISDEDLAEFRDFEFYHEWFLSDARDDMPFYPPTSRWPVIATGRGDEALDDGWHRLHAYVAAGDQNIPLLTVDFGDAE